MNRSIVIATTSIFCLCAGIASAQPAQSNPPSGAAGTPPSSHVAGSVPLGVTVTQMEEIVVGHSAKRDLLGKTVQNDKNEKIGKIDDIIISPRNAVSAAIIGVGGFVGLGKHDVAIPMNQIKLTGGNLVLAGATKDALKALPAFEYAPRKK